VSYPRVFVTNQPYDHDRQKPAIDVRPASKYGSIIFLTPAGGPFGNPSDLVPEIWAKLRDFNEEVDFIMPTGAPQFIALTGMLLGQLGIAEVSMLLWHRRDKCYYPERLILPSIVLEDMEATVQ
jgi:hypothetical protein